MFFVGADWSSAIMSQSNNRTSKLPSKGKYAAQSHRNGAPTTALRKEGLRWLDRTVQIHLVQQLIRKADSWSCLPLQVPLLTMVDWLPKGRKKLGMGMSENRVGKNSRNMKPNSKLYSANQFFDQKFQNRENHKVQKLFWCFSLSQNTPPVMCAKRKWGARGSGSQNGKG